MQVSRFSNGGFVIHKAKAGDSVLQYSAWYDADGNLLDAEGYNRQYRPFGVNRDGPVWESLARLGRVWKHEAKPE